MKKSIALKSRVTNCRRGTTPLEQFNSLGHIKIKLLFDILAPDG